MCVCGVCVCVCAIQNYENYFIFNDNLSRSLFSIRCQSQQDKLENVLEECETLRLESEEALKVTRSVERENKRLKVLSGDLGRQVKTLLKECEEARGGVASTSHNWSHDISSDDITTSSQVGNDLNFHQKC